MSANLTAIYIRLDGTEQKRREARLVEMRNAGLASFLERRADGTAVFAEVRVKPSTGSAASQFTYEEILADDRKLVQHKPVTPEVDFVLSAVRRSVMVTVSGAER